jgi:hypothetical protein
MMGAWEGAQVRCSWVRGGLRMLLRTLMRMLLRRLEECWFCEFVGVGVGLGWKIHGFPGIPASLVLIPDYCANLEWGLQGKN